MRILFQTLAVAVVSYCLVQTGLGQDPVKLSPDKYKVILDNDKVRVLDVRLKAGGKSPMHSHPNHVICSLTGGTIKFTLADGKTNTARIKAGQAVWHNAETHTVENVGKNETHVLDIELKR